METLECACTYEICIRVDEFTKRCTHMIYAYRNTFTCKRYMSFRFDELRSVWK
jgi:hypothetical protein